jgi:hypothetical protein
MSRYVGNNDECPACGTRYGDFKTGMTYREVWLMFYDNSPDPADWKYKRPGTILGKWHAIKKDMFAQHIEECTLAMQSQNQQQACVPF